MRKRRHRSTSGAPKILVIEPPALHGVGRYFPDRQHKVSVLDVNACSRTAAGCCYFWQTLEMGKLPYRCRAQARPSSRQRETPHSQFAQGRRQLQACRTPIGQCLHPLLARCSQGCLCIEQLKNIAYPGQIAMK
jgi:hypothetical protein